MKPAAARTCSVCLSVTSAFLTADGATVTLPAAGHSIRAPPSRVAYGGVIRGPPGPYTKATPNRNQIDRYRSRGNHFGALGKLQMELRQLITDHERQIFAKCLAQARATRGIGFTEAPRSVLAQAHIQFGNLYALFEDDGAPAEQMVGGFITHNLATFPQSCPKPDLSHLPPRYVLEGGELWSLSRGAGKIAHHVAAAVAGLLQPKAIIVYPMIDPVDLTTRHLQLGFVPACERVKWPWALTNDGGEILVQPLLLEGERLEQYIGAGFDFLFHANAGARPMLRFDRSIATQGPRREAAPQVLKAEEQKSIPSPAAANSDGEQRNGASAH
jgi:hypothetical protein